MVSSYLKLDKVTENEAGCPAFSMFGDLPTWGFFIRNSDGIQFKNVELVNKQKVLRPVVILDKTTDVTFKQMKIKLEEYLPIIFGDHSMNVSLHWLQFAKGVDFIKAILIEKR